MSDNQRKLLDVVRHPTQYKAPIIIAILIVGCLTFLTVTTFDTQSRQGNTERVVKRNETRVIKSFCTQGITLACQHKAFTLIRGCLAYQPCRELMVKGPEAKNAPTTNSVQKSAQKSAQESVPEAGGGSVPSGDAGGGGPPGSPGGVKAPSGGGGGPKGGSGPKQPQGGGKAPSGGGEAQEEPTPTASAPAQTETTPTTTPTEEGTPGKSGEAPGKSVVSGAVDNAGAAVGGLLEETCSTLDKLAGLCHKP